MEKAIKVDRIIYNNYKREAERIDILLDGINEEKAIAFRNFSGSEYDTAYSDLVKKEQMLFNKRNDILTEMEHMVIIKYYKETDVVDIGCIVSLTIDGCFGTIEGVYQLVGIIPLEKTQIDVISIDSPIGQSIYLQQAGMTVPYSVNGNDFSVKINEIIPQLKNKIVNTKKRKK